ncbi:MAG TPA: methyl-accepting chemotaxis protein [Dissulfurispiraceae bacterium]|nr:methyl-accepting chemotaxis protein [Dissulfurispiraceae bacterium]
MSFRLRDVVIFKNWPMFWKISLMPIMAVTFCGIGILAFVVPFTRENFFAVAVVLTAVSIVVTFMTFLVGGGFITKPVKQYGSLMQGFSDALTSRTGDLRERLPVKGKDEIGVLAVDINKVMDSYGEMVDTTLRVAGRVVNTTHVLNDNANRMTTGANKQAAQSHQMAVAAEEMSQTITDIARNASSAAETATKAMNIAGNGREMAQHAVETVNQVHISTTELADMVERLNGKVSEIGSIVSVIKDIADQTNLLALNAAIEAARAGEQGRGFAVVADEVRKLAEKTIKATADITDRIKAVQEESSKTTQSMHETAGEVVKADASIKEVMNALEGIVEAVMMANDQVTQIATAVEEQSAAAEEVVRNISATSSLSKANENMAAEVAKGSDKIREIIEADLKAAFEGFRTMGSDGALLDVLKGSFRSYQFHIGDIVSGKVAVEEAQAPDQHSSRMGKWYFGNGMALLGRLEGYKRLAQPHARIHQLGREIVQAVAARDSRAAAMYKDLTNAITQIQADIDAVKIEGMTRQ